jgi:hypothetical protein
MIRVYRVFDILVDEVVHRAGALRGLTVRALDSPAGGSPAVARSLKPAVGAELAEALRGLDQRALDADAVIGLGEALADLLLPNAIRELLVRSLDRLGPDEGLRMRLRLDPGAADIPWEYLFVPRQRGQRDATGFLALDPRISIVRDQTAAGASPAGGPTRQRRAVVALASPKAPGYPELKLADEHANIEAALGGAPGITADFIDHASVAALVKELEAGAIDLFHFAGHGMADGLVMEGAGDTASVLSGEQLAVNLVSRGAQLAVLGACETGRRDGANPWTGVATRLVGAGVPAVVAMQYRIGDGNAIEFGRSFYRALAAGVPVDGAVAVGRLAVFNRMEPHRDEVQRAGFWRDWGVPVLYLTAGASVDLASMPDPVSLAAARQEATLTVDDRIGTIGASGAYVGAEVGDMKSGHLNVRLRADLVKGSVTGARLERVEAGEIHVQLDLKRIDAPVIGVKVNTLGG